MLSAKEVSEIVEGKQAYLNHNEKLIDIFEGNLLEYLTDALRSQLSIQSFIQSMHRASPINILPKIIDKLTNIYQTSVTRDVVDGSQKDKDLLYWYIDKMCVNVQMNCANEMFNLAKSSLIQPYVSNGMPYLRVIMNDHFIVLSDDEMNPTEPTHVILLAKKIGEKRIYYTFSKDQFMISNNRGEIENQMMVEEGNPYGINPIGKLPFIYVNESKFRIMPKIDTDVLRLVTLLPVMLTDLNLAAMYQAFSIIYGINVDDQNIIMAPNAFWQFKSSDPESKPELGQLKPQVDYDQVINLIQTQLALWLNSKGIRPGSIGSLDTSNMASGISKLIDEMDTFEARQKQITYFQKAEQDLWDLILKHMHPYWVRNKMIENTTQFSPSASVQTSFAIQLPAQTRGQMVRDLTEEFAAGFISRRRAMMKINPELTGEEIDELLREIDEERGIQEVETEEPEEPQESEEGQDADQED